MSSPGSAALWRTIFTFWPEIFDAPTRTGYDDDMSNTDWTDTDADADDDFDDRSQSEWAEERREMMLAERYPEGW
jgi:hypothetical protein